MSVKNFIDDFKSVVQIICGVFYIFRIKNSSRFVNNRYLGEVIRETHSIEKGLSLEHVRMGFGLAKFMESDRVIKRYKLNGGDMRAEPMLMYIDALKNYLDFHKKNKFTNDVVKQVENNYNLLKKEIGETNGLYGGTQIVSRKVFSNSEKDLLKSIFLNRHSIREFDHSPVDMDDLKSAIKLAMHCPSACNRQCQRLYIVDKKDFLLLNNSFDGIGGFAEELDKILFITGSMSVYRHYETFQWIVTGSIFAAYLSLALEVFSIGSCFIQRPVLPNKLWKKVAKNIGASDDEQLICCMGIGNLKEQYKVPIYYRLDYDSIVTIVNVPGESKDKI